MSIGTMESTAAVRLPSLFSTYHRQHPDIQLKLQTGTTEALANLNRPSFIVFRRGCSYRGTLEAWAKENGIIPGQVMELGTLERILGFVNVGMGITLFPRSIVSSLQWKHSVRVHGIPPKWGRTSTLFIHRKDRVLTKALKNFIEFLSN